MFHRVKSDVQGTEQKNQPEAGKGYQRGAAIQQPVRQEPEKSNSMDEKPITRSYGGNRKSQNQEETSSMRTREETQSSSQSQAKYTRDTEESTREASPRATSYQPSVSRSSGYNTGSSYTATPYSATEAYSGGDRTLTIGRGINMSGEIDACDHLMVEGTVEAALKGAKLLEIAESGTFYGTVEIEEATIAGRFEGDITVNGRLTIKSSGVITGSIAYRELEVEAGALLDGRMTPIKGAVDPKSADKYRAGSEASAMAKPKDLPSKKDSREPANTESGLFSKAHASY